MAQCRFRVSFGLAHWNSGSLDVSQKLPKPSVTATTHFARSRGRAVPRLEQTEGGLLHLQGAASKTLRPSSVSATPLARRDSSAKPMRASSSSTLRLQRIDRLAQFAWPPRGSFSARHLQEHMRLASQSAEQARLHDGHVHAPCTGRPLRRGGMLVLPLLAALFDEFAWMDKFVAKPGMAARIERVRQPIRWSCARATLLGVWRDR